MAKKKCSKLSRSKVSCNDESKIYETLNPATATLATQCRSMTGFSSKTARCRPSASSQEELDNDQNERILASLAAKFNEDELEQDNVDNELIQNRLSMASSTAVYDVPRPTSSLVSRSTNSGSFHFVGTFDETDYLCRVGKVASRGLRPRPQMPSNPVYHN
jgi:hypothetical protein